MTARQLDELLRGWEDDLAAMTANLTALYEHPVYVTLAGTLHQPPAALAGRSRAEADAAVGRVRALVVHAAELRRVVDEARRLRAGAGFFAPNALAEAETLLNGESLRIEEPDDEAAPDHRSLLAGPAAPRRVRPRDLLARMETEFARARGVILAIDAAWQDAGGAEATEALARCETLLPGADGAPAFARRLDEARALVAARREQHRLDPLGSIAADPGPTLRALEADLRAAAARREECRAGIAAGRAWLQAAAERHARAAALLAERDEKTVDPANAPLPATGVLGPLGDWLEKLAANAGRGAWEAVNRALPAWRAQAANFDAAVLAAETQARSILAERLELRGRLDALQAKAAAAGHAEEPARAARLTAARQLLHARPTPMPEARARVEAYRAASYAR